MAKAKAKQSTIPLAGPGAEEPPRIETIDEQADKVSDLCERRKKLAGEETAARAVLLGLLDQHSLEFYKLESGDIVYREKKIKAKIRHPDEDEQQ